MKLKSVLVAVMGTGLLFGSCNQQASTTTEVNLEDEIQKVSYSIGVDIGNNFKQQGLEQIDPAILAQGIRDSFAEGGAKLTPEEAGQAIQAYFQKAQQEKAEKALAEGQAFLEANKMKDGVQITASGLQYKVLQEGEGDSPTLENKVVAHYHGTLPDGTVFDSSVDRGQPATFPVNGVIKGWQEALQMMKVGSKWELYIPAELGYGPRGQGKIPANSALVFEVELIEIQ